MNTAAFGTRLGCGTAVTVALFGACSSQTGNVGAPAATGGSAGSGGATSSGGSPAQGTGGAHAGGAGSGGLRPMGGAGNGPPSAGGNGGASRTTDAGVRATGGASPDAAMESGVPTQAPCPGSPPQDGSACASLLQCSWGDAPQTDCRTRGSCDGRRWTISPPPAFCTALPAACPSAAPTSTTKCGDATLSCLYADETLCACHACQCSPNGCPFVCSSGSNGTPDAVGTAEWYCGKAGPLPLPCPALVPNEGTSCEVSPTVHCPRGICGGLDVACVDGAWSWSFAPTSTCGVCASPDTPIATPDGERPIASLVPGDLVYSVSGDAIRAVPIARVSRTPVFHHHVVRVRVTGGRVLEISGGHPTADGRRFAELTRGGLLDGQRLESVEVIPYRFAETYDILPDSETATYFAAGMLIGSTLVPPTTAETTLRER